ncbi:hypothetical protein DNTS_017151, partial [Danionella cerebrum]
QPTVPLPVSIRCRLHHHSDCVSSGCGKNTVHELSSWTVPQLPQLCMDHDEQRGSHRLLQRICAIFPETGVMERSDVCLLRAAQTSYDGVQEQNRSCHVKDGLLTTAFKPFPNVVTLNMKETTRKSLY